MLQIQLYALLMVGGSNTRNMQSSFQIYINCVMLHLVGYILEYICDARTHERQKKKKNLYISPAHGNIYKHEKPSTHRLQCIFKNPQQLLRWMQVWAARSICLLNKNNHARNSFNGFNPLKPELNPICYLLALLAHHFLHVSRIRVKSLTLR